MDKVSTGLSSNHNVSPQSPIHNGAKNTSRWIDVMKLGSPLAIIRYNEGYSGVERICSKLEIETTDSHAFDFLDTTRARQNQKIVTEQGKRYLKKQARGRTQSKQKVKLGPGYAPGQYSGAKRSKAPSDLSSAEDFDVELDSVAPGLSFVDPAVSNVECCQTCRGTEENRLVESE